MTMDKNITGQANKVMVWLMKYYPVRIKNVGEQQKADRQTIGISRTDGHTSK